jgi:uncharacterized protein (TIGR03437 family)
LGSLNPGMLNAPSVDSSGNAWLTGTQSTEWFTGGSYVVELSADGSSFPFSQEFPAGEVGQAIAVDQSGLVHFAGADGLIWTITPGQPFAPRILSILSAAYGSATGLIAPGEVVSLFGLGLGPTSPVAATPANGQFPTSLGGVKVLVNGTPIPLLYVSASQINAEIPSPLTGVVNGVATLQVMNNSVPLPDFRLMVVNSDFAVFQKTGPSMAVINQDGTLNQLANPAKAGSTVTIWATGFGSTGPAADGAVVTAANNYCSTCQVDLRYVSTDLFETVEYAGTSPGLIDGLMQINIPIPAQWSNDGAFVYFTPPGYTEAQLLGWIDITQ